MLLTEFLIDSLYILILLVVQMAPFWIVLGLGYIAGHVWIYLKRAEFFGEQEYSILEFKLPEELTKTPLAMEVVFNALHQTGREKSKYFTHVLGNTRHYFSLEIISIEGKVRFLMRVNKKMRKVVEDQIYSQYPTVEIYETEDYTENIPYNHENSDWILWGSEFKLEKDSHYPIKTYVDYGLDKETFKFPDSTIPSNKVDPITPMIEFLGSLGSGEQAWYQILIRANKGKKEVTSYWDRDWGKKGEDEIEKIIKEAEGDDEEKKKPLKDSDKKQIESINKKSYKLSFDCGIRAIYLAKEDKFKAVNIPGLLGAVKHYGAPNSNGFIPKNVTDIIHPWEDYKNIRINKMKTKIFHAYRRRSWFFPPYERKPFVLNIEELATIYHFPGSVSQTPTFGRIESKKAKPPINLPT